MVAVRGDRVDRFGTFLLCADRYSRGYSWGAQRGRTTVSTAFSERPFPKDPLPGLRAAFFYPEK